MTGYVKSIWVSIRGDPVFMQRVNERLTIFRIAMIPISIATGWINSITYVASLSLWALVSGHLFRITKIRLLDKPTCSSEASRDVAL
jgi:hypothetical protein